ncbi:MAG: hypothetical protein PF693_04255 [Spirochaetia bacterium]|jgi:hypothetical protein|nr:hypothetical protein [Spirochaetia bacterium]
MGKDLILRKKDFIKMNIERGYNGSIFEGSMAANLDRTDPVYLKDDKGVDMNFTVSTDKTNWVDSKEYVELWNGIKKDLDSIRTAKKMNTAQLPADYYDFIDKMSMDVTIRRMQEIDYTALLTKEITRLDFSKSVNLKEFLGFVGQFLEHNLAGDTVPLMQQQTGVVGAIDMQGYALGAVRSLEDVLYNLDIYTIQKVNEAYVRAFIGRRNDLVWGPMIAITTAAGWDTSQTQAADATATFTLDEKVYATINASIDKLGALYDFQNNQEINIPKMVLAVGRNVDARKVKRAINGQLNNSKGVTANREALEIDEIWIYKGDSFFYGKEKVSYPGIAANKAYLFVPGPAGAPNYTAVKRPLVSVSSPGSALLLGQDEDAKYFIQKAYNDEWYGTSSDNSVIAANTTHNWGYIVEANLPS